MRFDVLTIFPDMITPYLSEGVLGRAIARGLIEVCISNIRDYARGPHRSTDDRPYGGGDGMVMKPGPLARALNAVDVVAGRRGVVLLTPQGAPFDQAVAWELSEWDQVVLTCGRYEGVDERTRECHIDRELSLGDYILSGGELAALVVMDAVGRLVPGVVGGERSTREDSFEGGLLEYPHYTRPRVFEGREVPPVLLSGNHEAIRLWRRRQSLIKTRTRRPDLFEKAQLSAEDERLLAAAEDDPSFTGAAQ